MLRTDAPGLSASVAEIGDRAQLGVYYPEDSEFLAQY